MILNIFFGLLFIGAGVYLARSQSNGKFLNFDLNDKPQLSMALKVISDALIFIGFLMLMGLFKNTNFIFLVLGAFIFSLLFTRLI